MSAQPFEGPFRFPACARLLFLLGPAQEGRQAEQLFRVPLPLRGSLSGGSRTRRLMRRLLGLNVHHGDIRLAALWHVDACKDCRGRERHFRGTLASKQRTDEETCKKLSLYDPLRG